MELPQSLAPTEKAATPPWQHLLSFSLLSDRALTLSAIVVAGGFLLSKVLGLAREVLIARAFGTSAELDAFKAANSFSDMLDSVIAGTTLAAVFIPIFSAYLVKGDAPSAAPSSQKHTRLVNPCDDGASAAARRAGWRFASAVLNDMFLLMGLIAGLGMLLAPQLIETMIAPGFDAAQTQRAADLMRIVLIAAIVFAVSGTVTGILHAHNRFALAALAPPLHNLGVIAALWFVVPSMGIYGLAWGVVFGSLLHLAIQIPGLVRSGIQYSLTLGWGQKSMGELLRLLGPRVVTTNLIHVTRLIMVNLASFLGEGSISALSYAYSLWQFPETLIGTAIGVVVFPRLAARAAVGNVREFNRLYRNAILTILALTIPAALVAVLFAQPIVSLLLERGAFDVESTRLVARVLQFYALAIVGESALEVLARVFYAQHDSLTPMLAACFAMALRVGLMVWWREALGAPGLALAYAIGVCLESALLWTLARRRFTIASAVQVE